MKQILFKCFKLSAKALRNRFEFHDRKTNAPWSDLVYELRGLENWLGTLKIEDFDAVKELMLTEQLKKRILLDIQKHYVDTWDDINDAATLAEKKATSLRWFGEIRLNSNPDQLKEINLINIKTIRIVSLKLIESRKREKNEEKEKIFPKNLLRVKRKILRKSAKSFAIIAKYLAI